MSGQLAPGLLIASPPMGDPNFDRTVVLLALHSDEGSLGFVVNRVAPVKLDELLSYAGYAGENLGDGPPVYAGGPVQPSSGWIVHANHRLRVDEDEAIEVGEHVRVTSSRAAFDRLAKHATGPDAFERVLVVLGYSGWGPGQLEGEIALGAWLPVPLDEGVLFDVDIDNRWERAYELVGLRPADVMSMRSVGEA